jgi:hypothetical protein
MEQITIAGKTFNAPLRYEEGHELTAGEASALNQTYHENLRNNFAKKVKDAVEAGAFDEAAAQKEFDAYAEAYAFGVRTGGGGGATRDPVMREALNIAKDRINAALVKKNIRPSSVDAAIKTAKAKELIAKRPDILELARTRIAEAQALATADLDEFVNDMPMKAA